MTEETLDDLLTACRALRSARDERTARARAWWLDAGDATAAICEALDRYEASL